MRQKLFHNSKSGVQFDEKCSEIFPMAVNWSSAHWGLMGYYKSTQTHFWYQGIQGNSFSISESQQNTFTDLLKKRIDINEIPIKPKFKTLSFPSQSDSWSCGLRVIYLTRCISRLIGSFVGRYFEKIETTQMRDQIIHDLIDYQSITSEGGVTK